MIERTSARRVTVLMGVLVLVVAACTLPDRNEVKTFQKPSDPPDLTPFTDAIDATTSSNWAANYSIVGGEVVSTAEVIYGFDKAFAATTVGGITLQTYVDLGSGAVTACVATTGVNIGCFPVSSGGSGGLLGSSPSDSSSSSEGDADLLSQVTGLINAPGTVLETDRVPPSAQSQCLRSPATKVSESIRVCVAEGGGLTYYDNGQGVIVQAVAYTNSVDPNRLVPPPTGGGLTSALG